MQYRADIDGLRAIAVLAVVIFHLSVPGFQGGYVGVDIFFVISGFLITSLIQRSYDKRAFKFSDFYFRRVRRLFPPLIATVATTIFIAAFIMTPYDMVALSRSAIAALFSFSNFVFYSESGYWDTASELKPLLHTWSLGVEEQFYLFWPAITVALLGIRRHIPLGVSLAIIAIPGAALCVWFTFINPAAAFYLLPFRVFQFAIGAAVIPLTIAIHSKTDSLPAFAPALGFWSGMLFIAISIATFGPTTVFPGYAVMLPTIGAALVLAAGSLPRSCGEPARLVMQNPLSVWLGKVSYSMYLVHWPAVALFRYEYGLKLTIKDQLILTACILIGTLALHYTVERRFYQRQALGKKISAISDKKFALRSIAIAGMVALIASSAWLNNGWAGRFPTLSLSAEQIKQGKKDRFKVRGTACMLGNVHSSKLCDLDADMQMLVLGNSAETDGFNFINAAYGENSNLNIILFGNANQCLNWQESLGHIKSTAQNCQALLDTLFSPDIVARLNVVLYAATRPYAEDRKLYMAILKRLKTINPDIHILTFGGYIITKRPCAYYINKSNTTDACAISDHVEYFADDPASEPLYRDFSALESHYIDRVDLLCKNRVLETCVTRATDGSPMLYDRLHNSLAFSKTSGKLYAKRYPTLLRDLKER